MRNVILSPAAKANLNDIWDYTENRWEVEQAESYARSIQSVCDDLAGSAAMGMAVDEIRSGYRRIIVGSHLLFYKIDESRDVNVMRILHQRMDVTHHL